MSTFRMCVAGALILLFGCQPPPSEPPLAADQPARRIVSLAPHITELVYAAGAGDKLVGVAEYSDFPVEARSLPRIGDSFRIDYEALRVLSPDLILSWRSGNPVELIEKLRGLNYRIVELEPVGLDDVAQHIELVGRLAGTEAIARSAAKEFRSQLAALQAEYAGAANLRLFYQIAAEPYFTVTGQHVINDAIRVCGGTNIFVDIAGLAPTVSVEAIFAENPQVIIASVAAGDDDWKAGWSGWNSVAAVRSENLYGINRDLISRSGPRIIQGVRQICAALNTARSRVDP